MNLKLKKFNMSSIKDDKVVIFIGKRDTGKSFLVRDLLWHHKDLPVGTVISGTEGANQFYSKTIPPIFIHDEYTPGVIDNFCKRQKKLVNRKVMNDPEYQDVDPRAFLILDDCLYDNSWVKDKKSFIAARTPTITVLKTPFFLRLKRKKTTSFICSSPLI